ncbi:MAG: DUF177 domain-containing protein [Lentisphaerae bacterium]|nr:DUF177 domain-containing protein [Lentisphaerota bacterium]
MITFTIGLLEKQDIDLAGSEKPEFLELEDDLIFNAGEPVNYQLKVSKVSGGALVTGRVSTVLSGACGRCLEPTQIELAAEDIELFVELDSEEVVDITEDIRAELLLNLPANLLCSDDCAGLCPVCGVNLNQTRCDCEPEDFDDSGPAEDEPSPWDALDGLKLDK